MNKHKQKHAVRDLEEAVGTLYQIVGIMALHLEASLAGFPVSFSPEDGFTIHCRCSECENCREADEDGEDDAYKYN